jgi:predicted  nucleic acid-binding Zn ribbon protein
VLRRGRLVLFAVQAVLLTLGALAASAIACEGAGEEKAESTTLSTKLSGESKEGEELTILEGSKVKDKATLSGKNASKATGKVTYKVYSEKECKTLVISAGEVTVSGESVPVSSEEELEGGKTYYWQAHYGGDSKNKEATSPCTEVLSVKAKTSLSTKLSGESKEGEELTVLEGSKVKDKATLSGTNSSTAGGKVLYKVFSEKECKTLVKEAGEVTVSSGSVPASSEEELEGGKTYYWQAIYKGDSLHQESTSTCGKEISNVKAKTTLTTSLKDEEHSGETLEATEELSVSDTATLGGINSSTASGTVTYEVYTEKECKTLEAEAGEAPVTSGTASASSEETLPAGTYYWQATYSGDSLHQESKSTCGKEIDTVKAAADVSTSLSGEEQSNNEISVVEGTGITDDATLNGPNASKAGGTVTYKVYSEDECKTLTAEAGKVTVTSGSVPKSTEEKLKAGTYYWQATYSGDTNDAGETTACGDEIAVVNATTSLATTLSGGGHEGETISVPEGTKIIDKATLSGVDASKAGGAVNYAVYSEDECKTLVAEAGHVTVTNGEVPSSSEEQLSPGTYYWQATYSGDSNNHSSKSGCKEEAVVKAATSLESSLSGGGQSHGKISVLEGTAVTDHATLGGADASKAGGTVTYDVYSEKECKTLVTEAGKVTVTSGSVPASTEEKLKPGTYYWQATYSGDANNLGSSDTCGSEILTVNKTLLATSLSGEGKSGEEIEVANGAIHDTATLSGEDAFMATGKVKYDVYSERECKTLVTEAGEVTVKSGLVPESKEETLKPGTYYWQATYSGDEHNEGSTTPCGTEIATVGPPPPPVEQVDFSNAMPVLIDHQTNSTSEKAEAIEEFAGHDSAQWEYAPTSHELVKSWPIAYVKDTTPSIKARFELPSATKQLIVEKRIEGKPVITGEAKLDGETITFTKEFASAEELETQENKHESYIEIGESTAITANKPLPERVSHEVMTIAWTWSIKITGSTEKITENLGSSENDLYLTYAEPSSAACKTVAEAESAAKESEEKEVEPGACTPIFFTFLDLASRNIEEGKAPEARVIAGVWKVFSKVMKEGFLPPNPPPPAPPWIVVNPQEPVPKFGPRIIDPRLAPPNNVVNARFFYQYYQPVFPGRTANVPVQPRAGCGTWVELLQTGQGRCGAWAELLRETLRVQGAPTARLVHLMVNVPRIAKCKIRAVNNEPLVCAMLVKVWGWPINANGAGRFPWGAAFVKDRPGLAGQGDENPPPFFWDHAIVKAGKKAEGSQALYDPSYGTGPFPANLKEIEAGKEKQPSEAEVLTKYQEASISGFCEPAGNARQQQPARCQINLPKTEGGELQLKAVGPNPGYAPTTIGWEP